MSCGHLALAYISYLLSGPGPSSLARKNQTRLPFYWRFLKAGLVVFRKTSKTLSAPGPHPSEHPGVLDPLSRCRANGLKRMKRRTNGVVRIDVFFCLFCLFFVVFFVVVFLLLLLSFVVVL